MRKTLKHKQWKEYMDYVKIVTRRKGGKDGERRDVVEKKEGTGKKEYEEKKWIIWSVRLKPTLKFSESGLYLTVRG